MQFDGDSTQTSRRRLLEAGKSLFAQHGYEQTSTAAIAREAGSSESQLVRYYGGKAGLLSAIFNESWAPMNRQMQTVVAGSATAHEALMSIMEAMSGAFSADPDLAFLLLFEGRRVRAGSDVLISKGFNEFQELLQLVIRRGHRDGTFTEAYNDCAVTHALMGAVESMLRERVLAHRAKQADPFTSEEMRSVLEAILNALSTPDSRESRAAS